MITADFHTHTRFSSDSDTDPEVQIKQAIRLGLRTLCITDHMDYLFPPQYKERYVFDPAQYVTALCDLQAKYADQISLRIGIELGLRNEPDVQADCISYYQKLTREYPFDFVIGSTHVLEKADPYYPEYWETHTAAEGLQAYFESILSNTASYDMFQVYGHLDYLVRYLPDQRSDYDYSLYRESIDEILRKLIALGKGIELNTAGYRYGLPYAHPRPEILRRYLELGGEIITLGSDAHKPEHLAGDFKRAGELLSSLGYRYYTIYKSKKPEFLPL